MYSEKVRELLTELNLQVDSDDPANTRGAILALVASLHPDKTGGSFANTAQKEKFDLALNLRDLFDREMAVSTQMVPIEQVSVLIEAIAKAQSLTQVKDQVSQPSAQEQFRHRLKRKYAFPKITSALIAALCFALFSFLGNFKNSPFYRLGINFFANGNKVVIINHINREGGRIKMNEAEVLPTDRYLISTLQGKGLIKEDDWPKAEWLKDSIETRDWLESNTAIGDIDLYSSDEGELFKSLEKINTQLDKSVTPALSALASEIKARNISKQTRSKPERNSAVDPSTYYDDSELHASYRLLAGIQDVARSSNQSISDLREWLPKAKKRAVDAAEKDILETLGIVTILACFAFIITWLRERSDQRWVEFISSDEGLELMFSRLCADKEIASRIPPRFQLFEFTQVLASKDVPQYLAPALGKHLDGKELGQVAASLIARLKEGKVITQVKAPTIKPWFEITATDFTDATKD